MNAQRLTTTIAGLFILVSLALAHFQGQVDLSKISWLWFTVFVGANLFQSGLTRFCLMTNILIKLGVKRAT
ncbi:MAG: rhodanese [Marinosulfonomonas sp.]|nr:MAG: rhodanese [Marinosulfonomonas sp.]